MLLGVGAVAVATLRPGWGHGRWLSTALLGVLLLKVPILGRVLSSEALLAIACVTPALLFLPHQPVDRLRLLGVLALVAFYCHGALQPGAAGFSPGSMNWVPLRGHIGSVHGVANLLETIWVFVALAFLSAPRRPRGRWPLLLQGLAILAAVFALEWYQQFLPGRYADISDVLVAFAAWWLAMRWGLRGAYAYCPVPPGRWGAWRFGVQDRTGTPR